MSHSSSLSVVSIARSSSGIVISPGSVIDVDAVGLRNCDDSMILLDISRGLFLVDFDVESGSARVKNILDMDIRIRPHITLAYLLHDRSESDDQNNVRSIITARMYNVSGDLYAMDTSDQEPSSITGTHITGIPGVPHGQIIDNRKLFYVPWMGSTDEIRIRVYIKRASNKALSRYLRRDMFHVNHSWINQPLSGIISSQCITYCDFDPTKDIDIGGYTLIAHSNVSSIIPIRGSDYLYMVRFKTLETSTISNSQIYVGCYKPHNILLWIYTNRNNVLLN